MRRSPPRFPSLALALLAVVLMLGACAARSQRELDLEAYQRIVLDDATLAGYPPLLQRAIRSYNDGEYADAATAFHDVIQDTRMRAVHVSAQYYLAECLDRLGLYQSAMTELANLLFRPTDIQDYTAAALKKLLALTGETRNERFIFQVLINVPIDRFPGSFRNQLVYMLGRYYYNERQYDRALEQLRVVDRQSAFYPKALYVRAVVHVIQKDYQQALRAFREIEALPVTYSDFGEASKVKEMARLALGQFLYKAGYEATTMENRRSHMIEAIRYYDQVDRETEAWVQALFQKTWATMLIGHHNTALGTVHTLESPFFESQFLPEVGLIEAITWYRLCKFDITGSAINDFVDYYRPMLDSTRAFLSTNERADPEEVFLRVLFAYKYQMGFSDREARDLLVAYRTSLRGFETPGTQAIIDQFERALSDGSADRLFGPSMLPLPMLTAVALNDQAFRGAQESIINLRRELYRLRSLPASFRESGIGQRHGRTLDRLLRATQAQAGRQAAQTLSRNAEYLGSLLANARVIQFELADARLKFEEQIERFGVTVQEFRQDRATIEAAFYTAAVADNEYYWPFQGEYWRDELGFYHYSVLSECR